MDVTVAICTQNRAALLSQTLNSISRMRIPKGISWEVVVVNNNSSDTTDDVILKHANVLPIRGDFESALGIANARNRAVAVAHGEYIIWLDDDVIVDPGLFSAYLDASRQWPDAAFFGGRVIPELEKPVPRWLNEAWATVPIVPVSFALRDYGDEPQPMSLESPRRIPAHANCAVRMAAQKAYTFHIGLGPHPTKAVIADESSYFFECMLRDGHKGYWVPSARVRHCIPKQRQTLRRLEAHCLAIGRGDAFRDRNSKSVRLFGAPRWLWRRVIGSCLRYLFCRLTSAQRVWLGHYVDFAQNRGALEYWLRLHNIPDH